MYFHLLEDFFPKTLLYKIILEPEKSLRKESLELVGLYFRRLFNKRTFFHSTFLVWNFRTFFLETFFQGLFLAVTVLDELSFLHKFTSNMFVLFILGTLRASASKDPDTCLGSDHATIELMYHIVQIRSQHIMSKRPFFKCPYLVCLF